MIDSNVLMRRAVQWVCEDNNLKPDSLKMFDTYTRDKFGTLRKICLRICSND